MAYTVLKMPRFPQRDQPEYRRSLYFLMEQQKLGMELENMSVPQSRRLRALALVCLAAACLFVGENTGRRRAVSGENAKPPDRPALSWQAHGAVDGTWAMQGVRGAAGGAADGSGARKATRADGAITGVRLSSLLVPYSREAVRAGDAVTGGGFGATTGGRALAAAALPPDRIGALRLDMTRTGAGAELQRQALLVVQAHPVGAVGTHETGRRSGGRDVLHYVQRLQPTATLKGHPPAELRLVLPGLHPLPDAKDPANDSYPGPLAEGEAYVLFLRPVGVPGLYTAVGGWQGIYPLGDDGRTIALAGAGFPQFGGLTPDELKARLQAAP